MQAAQRHRPDLIVLDVMLPDMDGFDVVRRLRGGGARIPVVFLTARDATEDKIRGLTLGGDDYVTKPFSLEEVIARIRAVLRRTRGDGTEPTPRLTNCSACSAGALVTFTPHSEASAIFLLRPALCPVHVLQVREI